MSEAETTATPVDAATEVAQQRLSVLELAKQLGNVAAQLVRISMSGGMSSVRRASALGLHQVRIVEDGFMEPRVA